MQRNVFARGRFSTFVGVLALGALLGCGGGGGGGGSAPFLSALTCTPDSAYVEDGGGLLSVAGTIDFSDPDGDLWYLTLTIRDSSGAVVDVADYDVSAAAGITVGQIQGEFMIWTDTADDYRIQIYVTDAGGRRSNTLEDLFRITEFPWVTLSAMPTPRWRFSVAQVGGLVYVIGGGLVSDDPLPEPRVRTVEIYHPTTDTWTEGPPMQIGLASQMTAVFDGRIYAIGGRRNADLAVGMTDVVQVYDPDEMTWTTRTPMPEARSSAAIVVQGGLIYVAGGKGNGGGSLDSLLVYDPVADTWAVGPPMNQARNVPGGGAVVAGKMLVYGGTSEGFLSSLESYDPILDAWSNRADGETRHDGGIAVVDQLMYAIGGMDGIVDALDRVRVYDYDLDRWASRTPMPVALSGLRCAVVGDRIYVFDSHDTLEYTPSNDLN